VKDFQTAYSSHIDYTGPMQFVGLFDVWKEFKRDGDRSNSVDAVDVTGEASSNSIAINYLIDDQENVMADGLLPSNFDEENHAIIFEFDDYSNAGDGSHNGVTTSHDTSAPFENISLPDCISWPKDIICSITPIVIEELSSYQIPTPEEIFSAGPSNSTPVSEEKASLLQISSMPAIINLTEPAPIREEHANLSETTLLPEESAVASLLNPTLIFEENASLLEITSMPGFISPSEPTPMPEEDVSSPAITTTPEKKGSASRTPLMPKDVNIDPPKSSASPRQLHKPRSTQDILNKLYLFPEKRYTSKSGRKRPLKQLPTVMTHPHWEELILSEQEKKAAKNAQKKIKKSGSDNLEGVCEQNPSSRSTEEENLGNNDDSVKLKREMVREDCFVSFFI